MVEAGLSRCGWQRVAVAERSQHEAKRQRDHNGCDDRDQEDRKTFDRAPVRLLVFWFVRCERGFGGRGREHHGAGRCRDVLTAVGAEARVFAERMPAVRAGLLRHAWSARWTDSRWIAAPSEDSVSSND